MKKTLLFVLGMHRSGTSAATRILNLAGVDLGAELLPPSTDNPEGFWEHQNVVAINEKIFAALDLSWESTLRMPEGWQNTPEILALREEALRFLEQEFGASPLFAIKDPRLCRTLPFWLGLLDELHIEPSVLFVYRPAAQVAASLARREQFPIDKSLLLYAWHLVDAHIASGTLLKTSVHYNSILADPVAFLSDLGLSVDAESVAHIKASVKPELNHGNQPFPLAAPDPSLQRLITEIEELENSSTSSVPLEKWTAIREKLQVWTEAHAPVFFWHRDAMRGRRSQDKLAVLEHAVRKQQSLIARQGVELEDTKRRVDVLTMDLGNVQHQNHTLIQERNYHAVQQEQVSKALVAMRQSTSWKITEPLRKLVVLWRLRQKVLRPSNYVTAWHVLRQQGTTGLRAWIQSVVTPPVVNNTHSHYADWIQRYETRDAAQRATLEKMLRELPENPLISVLLPVYNVAEQWLRAAIESVLQQTYPHWELCIADDASSAAHIRPLLQDYAKAEPRIKLLLREQNGHISASSNSALSIATGEFIALMDHDDLLSPEALFWVAVESNRHPDVQMMYSDEDKIDIHGNRYDAYFKSDWNRDLFYAHNMFSHLGVYKRALVEKVGGFREGFEGSQDYDLALRCMEQVSESQIRHIPRVLYHWRSIPGSTSIALTEKSYAGLAALRALREHFERCYPNQKIDLLPTFIPGSLRICWPLPAELPLVSIIIPTRNGVEILSTCIRSLLQKTHYPKYEIWIVDNQSDDPKTLAFFDEITAQHTHIHICRYDKPFNYSAINNEAARHAKGELLCLLNNDIEVMDRPEGERCWLTEMVSHAVREEVGAVGAKLYYPDGTVQHGGVLTGLGGPAHAVAGHLFVGLRAEDAGYFARGIVTQQLSGVTAACLLLRRAVFDAVGGLDAEHLSVAFNDVDLCLKIRKAGYKIIWTPFAELLHHESASRGREDTPEKKARAAREVAFMRKKWGEFLLNDPYYNPNLDYLRGDFGLAFPPRTLV